MASVNGNPTHRKNSLDLLIGIIQDIRQEVGKFKAEMVLRFDKVDKRACDLSDRIETMDQGLRDYFDPQPIRNDIAALQGGLQELSQNMSNSQKHVDDKITGLQSNINAAITASQDKIGLAVHKSSLESRNQIDGMLPKIGNELSKLNGPFLSLDTKLAGITTTIDTSRQLIKEEAGKTREELNDVITTSQSQLHHRLNAVSQDIEDSEHRISDKLDVVQGNIESSITGSQENIKQTIGDVKGDLGDHIRVVTTKSQSELEKCLSVTQRGIIGLVKAVKDTKLEMRAGNFNHAARLANKSASCCSYTIASMRGTDNNRIKNFPSTYSKFHQLGGEIDKILDDLGIGFEGKFGHKKERLRIYMGLRK